MWFSFIVNYVDSKLLYLIFRPLPSTSFQPSIPTNSGPRHNFISPHLKHISSFGYLSILLLSILQYLVPSIIRLNMVYTSPPIHTICHDRRTRTYRNPGMIVNCTDENYHGLRILEARPSIRGQPVELLIEIFNTEIYHYGVPIIICRLIGYDPSPNNYFVLRHNGWLSLPWNVSDPPKITRSSSAPPSCRRSPLRVVPPRRPSTP
ncbi:hypothetical protein F4805DRAFT_55975 [Annulohypoxylon moriforme]|nr:hypothetical protein F4805DRAFT_55975 [Annulohypoxylon moriforme]